MICIWLILNSHHDVIFQKTSIYRYDFNIIFFLLFSALILITNISMFFPLLKKLRTKPSREATAPNTTGKYRVAI